MLTLPDLRAMRMAVGLTLEGASDVVGEHRTAVLQQEAAGADADRQYRRQAMTAYVEEARRLSTAGEVPTGRCKKGSTYAYELRIGLGLSLRDAASILGMPAPNLQAIETPGSSDSTTNQESVWATYLDWFLRRQRRLLRVRQVPLDVSPEEAESRALELLEVPSSGRKRVP